MGITEVVLGLCDLFEAEGRLLQANVFRTIVRCTVFISGALFGVGALALLLLAGYDALLCVVTRPIALLISGALSAIVSLVLIWSAMLWTKRKK